MTKDITITEVVDLKEIKYLMYGNEMSCMLKDKEGYYAQIQVTMSLKDFVMWCPQTSEVVTISFDASYWSTLRWNLKLIFMDCQG